MRGFLEAFHAFGWRDFLRLTGDLFLPASMLAILFVFAPQTSFFTLFLLPLVLPFLAANFQKVWYRTMGRDDSRFSPYDFARYYRTPGLVGSLGLLFATVSGALVGYASFSILGATSLTSLIAAFGKTDILNAFADRWSTDQQGAIAYLAENAGELTGPFVILISASAFAGILVFFASLATSTQGYAFLQVALPDADRNILGSQARTMGKSMIRGSQALLWRRNWLLYLTSFLWFSACYGGFTALFSLLPTDYPLIFAGIPAGLSIVLFTPFLTLFLSSQVKNASPLIFYASKRMSERERESLETVFRSAKYIHTPESGGRVPFQGAESHDAPKGSIDVDPIPGQAEAEEGRGKEDEEHSFGFFDFSSEGGEEGKENKDNS